MPNSMYNVIIVNLRPYIRSACLKMSRNLKALTVEDLEQECSLKLLKVINKYKNEKTFDEIVKIYKMSIYNMLRDVIRIERYRTHGELTETIINLEHLSFIDFSDIVIDSYLIEIKRQANDETSSKILDLLLFPDKKLLNIVLETHKIKVKKAESGRMVMNLHHVIINDVHISKRLGISPATLSRKMKKIKQIVLSVIELDDCFRTC